MASKLDELFQEKFRLQSEIELLKSKLIRVNVSGTMERSNNAAIWVKIDNFKEQLKTVCQWINEAEEKFNNIVLKK